MEESVCVERESRYGKMLAIFDIWKRVHEYSLYYLAFHKNRRKGEKGWERQTSEGETGWGGDVVRA